MLGTLKKFKHIYKKHRLTDRKQQDPTLNEVFRQMSSFFHGKRDEAGSRKRTTKLQRMQLREQRLASRVNQQGTRKGMVTKHCLPLEALNDEQPEIVETLSPKQSSLRILCHICKSPYSEVHSFYGHLCPPCAQFNMSRRTQSADLHGLTALVTGARIKIGFEIALKLLRDGATVLATSRFGQDTLRRYQELEDYSEWGSRLHIIQCDFISQQQVTQLIEYVRSRVEKLDILINNAAQTIVRPKEFYSRELKQEQLAL
jgi:3-oxoacyl-ACP reductase-like protein